MLLMANHLLNSGETMNNDLPTSIKQANSLTHLVIMCSDDGSDWRPVRKDSVPDWIRTDPDIIKRLMDGECAQAPGETMLYGALGHTPKADKE